jgi:glycosyltransferase involved in cell wall biosynthesis
MTASPEDEMTKILFISYYFPPMGGAGVQRSQKFVQYLPGEGFLPVVVAGQDSAHEQSPGDRTLADGVPPDVRVYRMGPPPARTAGQFRSRLERLFLIPGSFSKWWIRNATETACRAGGDCRLIFATMSPYETAEVASEASRRLGIPWVADLRDPWALDEMQVYPSALHRRADLVKMERLLTTAAAIVMNTPDASAAVRAAFPRLRAKQIVTITNGFDRDDFARPVAPRTDNKFRIVHSGYLQTALGLQVRNRRLYHLLGGVTPGVDILTRSHVFLLEAVERWCAAKPAVRENLELLFAGQATEESLGVVKARGLSDVARFAGYLSHAESVRLVRTADLLFLPMHNLPVGQRCRIVPGKTYEYLASGRPILGAIPDGDARDFLQSSGISLLCRPDDVDGMIGALERAYNAWKSGDLVGRPRHAFIDQFERRQLTRNLADCFSTVLGASPRRAADNLVRETLP